MKTHPQSALYFLVSGVGSDPHGLVYIAVSVGGEHHYLSTLQYVGSDYGAVASELERLRKDPALLLHRCFGVVTDNSELNAYLVRRMAVVVLHAAVACCCWSWAWLWR